MMFPVLFSLPWATAWADEAPRRKPGLWEIQTESNGQQAGPGPIQTCIGPETDNVLAQGVGDMRSQCSKMETHKTADGYAINSVCKFGQTTATTEGAFTGSFDSAYRGDMHISYAPPIHGMAKADLVIKARWLGPCKDGQKAGDIVMPGMPAGMPKSINAEEMMRMREQMKRMQGR
jgi:hypothetical protein